MAVKVAPKDVVCGEDVMGMWNTEGIGPDPASKQKRTCTLKVLGKSEKMTIPVYTCTKVHEIKSLLGFKLCRDTSDLMFTYKQGGSYRTNYDHEEVNREITVLGISSFYREKKKWPHPHAIIGAGHIGLKMGMTWLRNGDDNFTIFDRRERVGGTSWHHQANKASRLQTEVGVYHLEYDTMNGWPADCTTNPWPSRDQLLERFHNTSAAFGILPYCRLETNITNMDVIGKDYWTQHYELTAASNGKEAIINAATVSFFPGNLTNPKRVIYKGEEYFGGDIVYGISSSFDYGKCKGNAISIIGCGAFAVENLRTCVEHRASKIYLICRRKNMAMPRMISWFINQSERYISAALTLTASETMYNLIDVDPWSYYCVYANEARTSVTIRQKCRFGIGDVYFLSMYYGHTDNVVDDIRRVSYQTIHLISGRTLENVTAMLKLLGFNGEFENDRLLKMKEIFGFWANKDFKRFLVAEPICVDANNFGGTSFSPGAWSWSEQGIYFFDYPEDWGPVKESGGLPSHQADESIDRPAYVVEARHGAITGICIGAVQGLMEINNAAGWLKRDRMWRLHPPEKFLLACQLEWENWSKMIQEMGYDKDHPPYPYTLESVTGLLQKESEEYAASDAALMKRMGLS